MRNNPVITVCLVGSILLLFACCQSEKKKEIQVNLILDEVFEQKSFLVFEGNRFNVIDSVCNPSGKIVDIQKHSFILKNDTFTEDKSYKFFGRDQPIDIDSLDTTSHNDNSLINHLPKKYRPAAETSILGVGIEKNITFFLSKNINDDCYLNFLRKVPTRL